MIETEIRQGDILECEREMFGAGNSHTTYRYKVVDVDGDEIEVLRLDKEDVATTTFERSYLIGHKDWHKLEE